MNALKNYKKTFINNCKFKEIDVSIDYCTIIGINSRVNQGRILRKTLAKEFSNKFRKFLEKLYETNMLEICVKTSTQKKY